MSALVLGATIQQELTETSRAIIAKDFAPINSSGAGLPPWVTGTTATFASPVFNRESPALLAARTRVAAAVHGQQSCEILVIGDSKSSNFQGAVLSWPEQLRRMLAASDGFVQADDGVMDPRWTLDGLSPTPTTSIGVQPTTPGSGATKSATFAADTPFASGTLYARIPGGGDATLNVAGTPQAVTIPNTAGWHPIALGTLPESAATITLTSTADLNVAGIRLVYDDERLLVSNPARPSSAAIDWSGTNPTGRWATVVDGPATSPDVIISALGTNEITDLAAISAYYSDLAALDVPVIVVSPGGLGGSRSRPDAEALAARLYSIAQTHDWPLIDLEQVIGQYTTAAAHGLMLDPLHENTRAALLEALGVHALIHGGIA